jgi:hypothetical protein
MDDADAQPAPPMEARRRSAVATALLAQPDSADVRQVHCQGPGPQDSAWLCDIFFTTPCQCLHEAAFALQGLTEGDTGLVNLGNLCFLNAAVQCLRCTPTLLQRLAPDLLADPSRLPPDPPEPAQRSLLQPMVSQSLSMVDQATKPVKVPARPHSAMAAPMAAPGTFREAQGARAPGWIEPGREEHGGSPSRHRSLSPSWELHERREAGAAAAEADTGPQTMALPRPGSGGSASSGSAAREANPASPASGGALGAATAAPEAPRARAPQSTGSSPEATISGLPPASSPANGRRSHGPQPSGGSPSKQAPPSAVVTDIICPGTLPRASLSGATLSTPPIAEDSVSGAFEPISGPCKAAPAILHEDELAAKLREEFSDVLSMGSKQVSVCSANSDADAAAAAPRARRDGAKVADGAAAADADNDSSPRSDAAAAPPAPARKVPNDELAQTLLAKLATRRGGDAAVPRALCNDLRDNPLVRTLIFACSAHTLPVIEG